ncbi:MAG: acetoacetate--CoA ligase [Chitinophagales bacterium]
MSIEVLWKPSDTFKANSNLKDYENWLSDHLDLRFDTYETLRQWSVDHIDTFWESIWQYYNIIAHHKYDKVVELPKSGMIGTKWFKGSTLNYSEHIFRNANTHSPAIIFQSEKSPLTEISWQSLRSQVASLADYLISNGVTKGDRVASFLPNIPEAIIAFLATNSIGAVWSSCSPDFGAESVIDRFNQIEPKVIFIADGYYYNGKTYNKTEANVAICKALPSLSKVVFLPYTDKNASIPKVIENAEFWANTQQAQNKALNFASVSFDHPLWILYSSGTTGKPKAITHSNGGNLIEHLKVLGLHQNCKPGERFFWYSTTGWMMWNYSIAALLHGTTVCIYDGSAGYPNISALWDFARTSKINHFGAGASFYIACMKEGLNFIDNNQLPDLKSIGSTGSPLPPEAWQWIYDSVKKDVWLISLSGGTDVCSGFVGGNPYDPLYKGEIQCRLLGCDLQAWDENGSAVIDQLGEMVITQPMPSMPIYFWNDEHNERYQASYFEMYPNVWRHGDWIKITERNTLIIFGRSDATLNRGGVRIGTSEVYSGVEKNEEIKDSLVICIDKEDGSHYMPLFVVLQDGVLLTDELKKKVSQSLRAQFSPRHVPDDIFEVKEVPYTISGKKMETPVKKILSGIDISNSISKDAMKNPQSLDYFTHLYVSKKSKF